MRSAETHSTDEADRLWQERTREFPRLAKTAGTFFSEYFRKSGRDLPWRKARDAYLILVAEVMLQKTHNRAVPAAWLEFTRRWPTPDKAARARLRSLERVLRPLGLKKRAAWLREIAQAVAAGSKGLLSTYEGLRSLPGVGKYTASAVLCQAIKRQMAMVDVNAARVYCRLYGVQMRTSRQALLFAERAATETIRHASARAANLGLLDFAQAVCTTNPQCATCPILKSCVYGSSRMNDWKW